LSLAKDSDIFEVWGTGNQIRDFIHIEDCITGILLTKDKINDGSPVNLGTGIGTSFKTLAALVLEELGRQDISVIGLSDKPEGVFARVADTSFAESLGFKANKTLAEGVRESLALLQV
jgi:GDP-L-fucose synthase